MTPHIFLQPPLMCVLGQCSVGTPSWVQFSDVFQGMFEAMLKNSEVVLFPHDSIHFVQSTNSTAKQSDHDQAGYLESPEFAICSVHVWNFSVIYKFRSTQMALGWIFLGDGTTNFITATTLSCLLSMLFCPITFAYFLELTYHKM